MHNFFFYEQNTKKNCNKQKMDGQKISTNKNILYHTKMQNIVKFKYLAVWMSSVKFRRCRICSVVKWCWRFFKI